MQKILFFLSSFLPSLVGLAHGENKPGPHGGFIRMPGGFHTEVAMKTDNQIAIYLLDFNFKNPTTVNSTLKASIAFKSGKSVNLSCKPVSDHFLCTIPNKTQKNLNATLVLKANRKGETGGQVQYFLPLMENAKLWKSK